MPRWPSGTVWTRQESKDHEMARTLLIVASTSALAACGQVAPAPSDFASPSTTQTATAAVPATVMQAVERRGATVR